MLIISSSHERIAIAIVVIINLAFLVMTIKRYL
jgi:hypothetical protein